MRNINCRSMIAVYCIAFRQTYSLYDRRSIWANPRLLFPAQLADRTGPHLQINAIFVQKIHLRINGLLCLQTALSYFARFLHSPTPLFVCKYRGPDLMTRRTSSGTAERCESRCTDVAIRARGTAVDALTACAENSLAR